MGLFSRRLQKRLPEPSVERAHLVLSISPTLDRDELGMVIERQAIEQGVELIEVDVVGEGFRQAELEQISGPRDAEGKAHLVGAVLRCDPANEHDRNAIRVEVMGLHVGFLPKETAQLLSPSIQTHYSGVIEAVGVIVGGWDDGMGDAGHYGIRLWIDKMLLTRTGLLPDRIRRQR